MVQPEGRDRAIGIAIGPQGGVRHIVPVAGVTSRIEHTLRHADHRSHESRFGPGLNNREPQTENETGKRNGACENRMGAVQNKA